MDSMIPVDSEFGKAVGFTSDKFTGFSYLWLKDDEQCVYISLIESLHPGEGNLSRLFSNIEAKGYQIRVPTPFDHMQEILMHKGFVRGHEYSKEMKENVEVWSKPR